MALTQYYVDPTNGTDTPGNGTATGSSAWKTTQYALNHITQGTTGDQVNVCSVADDVLAAILSLATYGTPTIAKPLLFRGYTSTANDGGIGGLNGNAGNFSVISSAAVGVWFQDMHLHNCGTSALLSLTGGGGQGVVHCELDTTTGVGLSATGGVLLIDSYLHDIGGTSMSSSAAPVLYSRFETLTKSPQNGIVVAINGVYAFNTVALTAAAISAQGISVGSTGVLVFGNSVWANAGTGHGIILTSSARTAGIWSNIVEGFTGGASVGITDGGGLLLMEGLNFLFNNTTGVSLTGETICNLGSDTTTGSSSFNNPSGTPHDLSLSAAGITACKGQAYPKAYYGSPFTSYRDAGAVQHQDAGAGGSSPLNMGARTGGKL